MLLYNLNLRGQIYHVRIVDQTFHSQTFYTSLTHKQACSYKSSCIFFKEPTTISAKHKSSWRFAAPSLLFPNLQSAWHHHASFLPFCFSASCGFSINSFWHCLLSRRAPTAVKSVTNFSQSGQVNSSPSDGVTRQRPVVKCKTTRKEHWWQNMSEDNRNTSYLILVNSSQLW